jgi:hypothetical protein
LPRNVSEWTADQKKHFKESNGFDQDFMQQNTYSKND